MPETNIPISEATLARLREVARWAGISVDAALDQAVRELYDRRFWPAVDAGYKALRTDEKAWAEVDAERKAWDGALTDGLDPSEHWGDGGAPAGTPEATQ